MNKKVSLLKLASYLKGHVYGYGDTFIIGFLNGMRYLNLITDNDVDLVCKYIHPEIYFKNYTEIDYHIPRIKRKLSKISFYRPTIMERIYEKSHSTRKTPNLL